MSKVPNKSTEIQARSQKRLESLSVSWARKFEECLHLFRIWSGSFARNVTQNLDLQTAEGTHFHVELKTGISKTLINLSVSVKTLVNVGGKDKNIVKIA